MRDMEMLDALLGANKPSVPYAERPEWRPKLLSEDDRKLIASKTLEVFELMSQGNTLRQQLRAISSMIDKIRYELDVIGGFVPAPVQEDSNHKQPVEQN